MSYIQNFKKFIKSDEKKTQEMGANPSITEQDAPAEPAKVETPAASSTTVESNPTVVSARTQLANAIANRDKVVTAKQKELADLKLAQDALVNTATTNLNNAIAAAAKTPTT